MKERSLSARRAWIEIDWAKALFRYLGSLSARRAWIEIAQRPEPAARVCVALRKESVDRNLGNNPKINIGYVALRKESVDRNLIFRLPRSATVVALRKESVDRNIGVDEFQRCKVKSLSARRAWIEILGLTSFLHL